MTNPLTVKYGVMICQKQSISVTELQIRPHSPKSSQTLPFDTQGYTLNASVMAANGEPVAFWQPAIVTSRMGRTIGALGTRETVLVVLSRKRMRESQVEVGRRRSIDFALRFQADCLRAMAEGLASMSMMRDWSCSRAAAVWPLSA